MRKIVDFMIGMSIQAGSFKTVFDYLAKGGSGPRGFDEWLNLDLTQLDGFAGGKTVATGEDHDQRLRAHALVDQTACVWFGSHECGIEPALQQSLSQFRGIVA